MPPERHRAKPNPHELEHAWTREEGMFAPTPSRERRRLAEEERLAEELHEEARDPSDRLPEGPRFPEDRRRHAGDLAAQEAALAELHEARGRERLVPEERAKETKAAQRHTEEAERHRKDEARYAEIAAAGEDLRSVAVTSDRSIATLQVALPIGIGAAILLVLAGLLGFAVFGVSAATTVAVALAVGILVNGAILFGLLSNLRATDRRVRQLAQIEAARQADRVPQRQRRQAGKPVREEVHMHRVEVRPERRRTTVQEEIRHTERRR